MLEHHIPKRRLRLLVIDPKGEIETTVRSLLDAGDLFSTCIVHARSVPQACELVTSHPHDVIIAGLPLLLPHDMDWPQIAISFSLIPILGLSDYNSRFFLHPSLEDNIVLTLPPRSLSRSLLEQALIAALERSKLCKRALASQSVLHFTQRRLQSLIADHADGILVADMTGKVLLANPSAGRIFGIDSKELIGKPFAYPLVPGNLVEIEVTAPDGSTKSVEMRVVQSNWGGGMGMVHLASMRDMSARKRLENDLLAMKEAAEAANNAKAQFLANMSHEIRTPMNGILGMAELIGNTSLDEKQRNYLDNLVISARSLTEILNDVLDFSTLEAGKLQLENAPFVLRQVVEAAVCVHAALASRKGLALSWQAEGDLPHEVAGDAGRLRQIIMNLVGNAVKFTETGQVCLRIMRVSAPASLLQDKIGLRFAVSDTGPGIAKPKLDTLFESFHQADNSPTRKHYGTGLGLALCKGLVERMGGSIQAHSRLGAGSVFSFEVLVGLVPPPQAPAASPVSAAPSEPPAPLTILLAEDNMINQLFAIEILEQEGHSVIAVGNGQEALDVLAVQHVDAVLMDIQMPELDGLQTTNLIRNGEVKGVNPRLPIIAMTAHALKGDKARFLAAGMDGYLSKPVSSEEIRAALTEVLQADRRLERADISSRMPLNDVWLLEKARGNKLFVKKLVQVFVNQQPEKVQEMLQAGRRGDMEALAFMAHTFKGGAATMGAELLKERSALVEKAAKSQNVLLAVEQLAHLERELETTLVAMRAFLES